MVVCFSLQFVALNKLQLCSLISSPQTATHFFMCLAEDVVLGAGAKVLVAGGTAGVASLRKDQAVLDTAT